MGRTRRGAAIVNEVERTPHMIKFDSQGRLIVADRQNHRIQILTKDGKYVGEYREFSRASGFAIDGDDTIYVADSESTPRSHPGWLKGIRIGSLKDGKVTTFVPPHKTDSPDGAMGEGKPIALAYARIWAARLASCKSSPHCSSAYSGLTGGRP